MRFGHDAACVLLQLTSLQTMAQQLEQQKQQLADVASQHQTEVETLARLLQGVYTRYLHTQPVTTLDVLGQRL